MTIPEPFDPLSGPLGAEYDQSHAAQRDRVIAELKQVIERVPEQTEFTNSRRYRVWGPVLLIGSLVLMVIALRMDRLAPFICTGFMTLIAAAVTWQHRNSGTQVFMRLTRRQLFVDTLEGPVDLAQVEDISVKDEGLVMMQTLDMSSDAVLPKHRVVKLLQIRVMSAGLATGGRKLDNDEVLALLVAYRDAAYAQRRLEMLQAHG